MTKTNAEKFADQLRRDHRLADAFAKAVAEVALQAGHIVSEAEVISYFIDERHAEQGGQLSTMAVGEEDGPRTRPLPEQDRPRVTSMAMGEESRKPTTPSEQPRVTTMAMGEESGKPATPSERPKVTSMAMGEEDKKPKPPKSGQ